MPRSPQRKTCTSVTLNLPPCALSAVRSFTTPAPRAVLAPPRSPSLSQAFVGFDDAKVWWAVLGIVFADISMTILFKQLGSNTYSFSRAISTCSLGIYAFAMGGAALQSQFWIGAALVTTAAFMYKSGAA